MSFVMTQPYSLAAAAGELRRVGSTMATHNAAAAIPKTKVVPAAADEVFALTTAHFAIYAHIYQEVRGQARAVHEAFTTTSAMSADSYAPTAANVIAAG